MPRAHFAALPMRLQGPRGAASFAGMMDSESPLEFLRTQFSAAIAACGGPASSDPALRVATDPKFGDYQCSAAMALAKPLGLKPREVAERLAAAVAPRLAEVALPLEIAGPGFLNIRLRPEYLAARLERIPPATDADADRIGLPPTAAPRRIVVDYSSPNIAKQMHVGHLRSTIIGDVFARLFAFQGHTVIRQNHVGDWGTQFGMLIEHYATHAFPSGDDYGQVLAKIEDDYRAANDRFTNDSSFANAARAAVERLQSGDAAARDVWRKVCAASSAAFRAIYRRLNVQLIDDDVCGESFYNPRLAAVIRDLEVALPARVTPPNEPWAEYRVDAGAACVFLYKSGREPAFKNPEGDPLPLIVRKSDGAFLYATTDLAAIRYRVGELCAARILYVVGAPTKLHLDMVFATARFAGWAGPQVALEHVSFGQVLGEDRKLLRTRSGGAVKLGELLDEAEKRAAGVLEDKLSQETDDRRDSFSAEEKREIARRVGIGAVKYFDLARERNSDYVFNWDTMLALQGNTAPYMLYAYARIRSIYRKAEAAGGSCDVHAAAVRVPLKEAAERALALRLVRLGETLEVVAADLTPHVLCTYLYELAGEFMRFYESCPVTQAPDAATRAGRMRLCDLTARTLRVGLGILGIEVVERM